MKDVEVAKAEVIKRLEENKTKHQTTYAEAVDAYKARLLQVGEQLVEDLRKGLSVDPFALGRLPVPEEHSNDYDTAIDMLTMEHRDFILISSADFRTYMRDEWNWQSSFTANTVSYTMQG
jgi:hypothetical protein